MADTRPGGRTARTREAVHAAVCALFAEGREPLSVREVSLRSCVHEVTICRRWKTIESLALDVAVTRMNEEFPFPDSGDLRRSRDDCHSADVNRKTFLKTTLGLGAGALVSPPLLSAW